MTPPLALTCDRCYLVVLHHYRVYLIQILLLFKIILLLVSFFFFFKKKKKKLKIFCCFIVEIELAVPTRDCHTCVSVHNATENTVSNANKRRRLRTKHKPPLLTTVDVESLPDSLVNNTVLFARAGTIRVSFKCFCLFLCFDLALFFDFDC